MRSAKVSGGIMQELCTLLERMPTCARELSPCVTLPLSPTWNKNNDIADVFEKMLDFYDASCNDTKVEFLVHQHKSGCEWCGEVPWMCAQRGGGGARRYQRELEVVLRAMRKVGEKRVAEVVAGRRGHIPPPATTGLSWACVMILQKLVTQRERGAEELLDEALEKADEDIMLSLSGEEHREKDTEVVAGLAKKVLRCGVTEVRVCPPRAFTVGEEERGLEYHARGNEAGTLILFVAGTPGDVASLLYTLADAGLSKWGREVTHKADFDSVRALSLCPMTLFRLFCYRGTIPKVETLRLCATPETDEIKRSNGLPLSYILKWAFDVFPHLRSLSFENWKGCGCARALVDFGGNSLEREGGMAFPDTLEHIQFPHMRYTKRSWREIEDALARIPNEKRRETLASTLPPPPLSGTVEFSSRHVRTPARYATNTTTAGDG